MNEKERKNRDELFRLMRENPDLPVVAMVDSEIVADDGYNRWLGAWGYCEIGEYFVGDERVHFRESDDFYEIEAALTAWRRLYWPTYTGNRWMQPYIAR